ncbi:hypothetical protein I6E42_02955 [Pseudoflavonifractor phocaeensis]|nr:hypothetical protein [Pseudoflavonifractor phocaeensis]
MALNADEGEDMVDEAAKSGRKLMVCRVQRPYEP